MMGRVPATWWTSFLTAEDCVNTPVSVCSGHITGPMGDALYGAMHGEDIWMSRGLQNENWVPTFIREFCTYQVPYFYLNRYQRLSMDVLPEGGYRVIHSDGVVSNGHTRTITKNSIPLKQGNDVILPLTEDNRLFVAYSDEGRVGKWYMPDADFAEGTVYEITDSGNQYLGRCRVIDGAMEWSIQAGQGIVICAD